MIRGVMLLATGLLMSTMWPAYGGITLVPSERISIDNVLAVSYGYESGKHPLPRATESPSLIGKSFKSANVNDWTRGYADLAFRYFVSSDCPAKGPARLIWFTGRTMETPPNGNIQSMYGILVPDGKKEVFYPIDRLFSLLSSSDCQFVLGMDAAPPRNTFVAIPRNVAVIWNGWAKDDANVGLMTISFVRAIDERRTWKLSDLVEFLQTELAKQSLTQPTDKKHDDESVGNVTFDGGGVDKTYEFPGNDSPLPRPRALTRALNSGVSR